MRNAALSALALGCLLVPPAWAADVPWDQAEAIRSRLLHVLKDRKATNENLLAALDAAHKAYPRLRPDPPAPKSDGSPHTERELASHRKKFEAARKKWRKAVEQAYLKALALKRLTRGKKPINERVVVNLKAARALADTRPEVASRTIALFERRLLEPKDHALDPRLYESTFQALAKLNGRGSFVWLRDEVLIADRRPDYKARTIAALNAMRRFPLQRPRIRNETVKRLIRMFEFVERQADFAGFGDAQAMTGRQHTNRAWIPYWKEVKPIVIATLRHLSTDPRTREAPVDYKRKKPLVHVADYARWYSRNKRLGFSPWINPKKKRE